MILLTFHSYAGKRAFLKTAHLQPSEIHSQTAGSLTLKVTAASPTWATSPHVFRATSV